MDTNVISAGDKLHQIPDTSGGGSEEIKAPDRGAPLAAGPSISDAVRIFHAGTHVDARAHAQSFSICC